MRCGRTAVSTALLFGCAAGAPAVMSAQQVASTAPAVASPQASRATRMATQGFSVMLVIADIQTTSGGDDVPPAARQALADMKDFLPYKSYKLLDAAWIMGTGRTSSRLRGPDEREYEVEIVSTQTFKEKTTSAAGSPTVVADDGRIFVQFSLREASALDDLTQTNLRREGLAKGEEPAEEAALRAQVKDAEAALKSARSRNASGSEIQRLERQLAELKDRLAENDPHSKFDKFERTRLAKRGIMNTTFTMESGETVVVGTSRLRGNSKALIALLTAVPQRNSRVGR